MKSEFKVIDLSETTMTIEAIGSDGCQSCQKSVGCGNGNSIFMIPKRGGTLLGDKIYIEVATSKVFLNGFITYILPIIMLFLGIIYASENNELIQIFYGFGGFFGIIILNRIMGLPKLSGSQLVDDDK